jgi:hypothetical protein
VRLEGLRQLKNPMTSSGIEPATFLLVAQCINQLRYRVLPMSCDGLIYYEKIISRELLIVITAFI